MATYRVWRADSGLWMFEIEHDGTTIKFGGIPNKCFTKRQAIARAVWRKRWIERGEYHLHYRDVNTTRS